MYECLPKEKHVPIVVHIINGFFMFLFYLCCSFVSEKTFFDYGLVFLLHNCVNNVKMSSKQKPIHA